MIIVLEGPDGSGKSTLADRLSQLFDLNCQHSEGRPKYPGEFVERVTRYNKMSNVVFDRHPIISQPIYSALRASIEDMPTEQMLADLYDKKPFIIYCRATDLNHHQVKAYDDAAHLKAIEENAQRILDVYDDWAVEHAHWIYRIGQRITPIIAAIEIYTGE